MKNESDRQEYFSFSYSFSLRWRTNRRKCQLIIRKTKTNNFKCNCLYAIYTHTYTICISYTKDTFRLNDIRSPPCHAPCATHPPAALELRGIVISLNLNLYSLASYREFVAHMTKRNEHAPGGRWRKVGGRRPHPHPYPAPSISTPKFPLRTRMAA